MIYDIAKIRDDRRCTDDDAWSYAVDQIKNNWFTVPRIGTIQGGGSIYLPSGTYRFQNQCEIPRHTIARGDGDSSVLVWPAGKGLRFESFPNVNYANRAALRDCTIVNDAEPRAAFPDLLSFDRYVGADVQGGATQSISGVWSIGWETHYRLSQAEIFSIDSCTFGGRAEDELRPTVGVHTCTLPNPDLAGPPTTAGATNINWFSRLHFSGPYHPAIVDGDVSNVFQRCHVNASGPILFGGNLCTFEDLSFEGGPEDECMRPIQTVPGTIPFIMATMRRCYVAADKHLLRIPGGSAYGLNMQSCFTQASTKALLKIEGLLAGPVIFDGNQAWGAAPLVDGDVYNVNSAFYASAWHQATQDYERTGIGIRTLHPTDPLTVK